MSTIIDISQALHPGMFVYPGDPRFSSRPASSFAQGNMCEVSELTVGTHCGTHIDAPLHMIEGGAGLESMPLDVFVGPCRVLTLPTAVIHERMLLEHDIQPGERILLRTDPHGEYHRGAGQFNPSVLSVRAARLLAEKGVRLVGIDSPTVENMEHGEGEIHRMLMCAGVAILEGLCLEAATKERYLLCALPLNMPGENGSPCRAVLIEE